MGLVWKGVPWITAKGYRRGRVRDYPYPRKSGQIYEHVAVMELHLGRQLEPWESVHHKDEEKLHNAASNLEVREIADHTRHHNRRARAKHLAQPPVAPIDYTDDTPPF